MVFLRVRSSKSTSLWVLAWNALQFSCTFKNFTELCINWMYCYIIIWTITIVVLFKVVIFFYNVSRIFVFFENWVEVSSIHYCFGISHSVGLNFNIFIRNVFNKKHHIEQIFVNYKFFCLTLAFEFRHVFVYFCYLQWVIYKF